MSNFRKLEGDTVTLVSKGSYYPSDLYERAGDLYAKFGSGYVRLRSNGTTTKDGVGFDEIETNFPVFGDKFGRLTFKEMGEPLRLEQRKD